MNEFDFETLCAIGLNHNLATQWFSLPQAETCSLMRVIEVQRDWLHVHDGHTEYAGRVLPALSAELYAAGTGLAVGDWVGVKAQPQGEWWVHCQLAPQSHLARRANDGRRQPLASNIDTALLVMGLDHDFNLRRIERYLALVQAAGVMGVVVFTKVDIGHEVEARMAQLHERLPRNVPTYAVNALALATQQELAPWLGRGQTLVLLGSSGAGKSTLTNTLSGSSVQQTGGLRQGDGRGRHTTTARSLHLCPEGACIIDTPGLRTWRPDADADSLAATFEDIEALAQHCHFRDCQHGDEPGCAVRDVIPADRLLNYHKLLREVRRSQQTPLERKAQQAKWKVIGKAGKQRNQEKRRGNL
ncbi:ribosome small subunit-dependent GTPase A [Chitinimonas sp. BJB300]|uniref:ribosome small subunit-dependent GTPase A n=1 Tax=Chitinimonas sp. BJB300 TaxID=1559339 RepID=UPI000C0CBE84|nr:ribosome small subunit-dependent GTPase A [Chitinimonas sp. BJB300]PHV13417.1 ribosome small subunit-dependent GTPase A [Chitinimonas sp. BJB300]TSJ89737.1 ribosome small subunit-dependent GTPase A [Chitinimonas sp. BJB300]